MRQKQYINLLKNRLKQEDAEDFMEWINSIEGEKEALDLIEKEWKNDDATDSINDVRLNELLTNINEHIADDAQAYKSRFIQFAKIAAILVTGLSILFFVFNQQTISDHSNTMVEVKKSNPSGQKSIIFLPDGSKVYLNAESRIAYPDDFMGSSRNVKLEGEAFFEVARDEERPFIVSTGQFSTTAIVTSFNIRAYKREEKIEVSLATGKVLVSDVNRDNDRSMFLTPGEQMVYLKESDKVSITNFDDKSALGWKEGLIYFDQADFDEVIRKLSRWYGVEFNVQNKPDKGWIYNGEFRNQSLEHVLMGMSLTKNFQYEIDSLYVNISF